MPADRRTRQATAEPPRSGMFASFANLSECSFGAEGNIVGGVRVHEIGTPTASPGPCSGMGSFRVTRMDPAEMAASDRLRVATKDPLSSRGFLWIR